jgi:hypothetical protein
MEASEARELAEKIIILDDSIIACGFVTHNGIALAGATKDSFRSRMPKAEFWQRGAFEKLWESIAFRATQLLADAKTKQELLSPLESVIVLREKLNVILLWVQSKTAIAGFVFAKSGDELDINKKVRHFLGLE